MTINTVYEALSDAIQTDGDTGQTYIDLWTASNTYPALTNLEAVLGLFGITSSYILYSPVLNQSSINVTLAAVGRFGQPGAPEANMFAISAALVYTDAETNPDLFSLSLRVTDSGWTFSGFFNILPDTEIADADAVGSTWQPSFLIGVAIDHPVFSGRNVTDADGTAEPLSISGYLQAAPVFAPYDYLISPWPLRLAGTLAMPASWDLPPTMQLTAMAGSGSNIVIPSFGGAGGGPPILSMTKVGYRLGIYDDLDAAIWGRTSFSVLDIIGTLTVGGLIAEVSTQILSTGTMWHMIAEFDPDHADVVKGMAQLLEIFGVPALPLPDNFPGMYLFKFRSIELFFTADGKGGYSLSNLTLTIGSDLTWTPPVPFVTISNLGTSWVWGWTYLNGESVSNVTGSVFGSLSFGGSPGSASAVALPPPGQGGGGGTMAVYDAAADGAVTFDISLLVPDLYISAMMREGDYIAIGDAFNYFFGADGPYTAPDMNITVMNFDADIVAQTYSAFATIVFGDPEAPDADQGWTIDLVVLDITLLSLEMFIRVSGGKVSGGISGVLCLDDGADPDNYLLPRLMVSAEYPQQDPDAPVGWIFAGYLYPGTSISLTSLVTQYIYGDKSIAPAWVPNLLVDRLYIEFSTGSDTVDSYYKFGGTISLRWNPEIFGTTLKITASTAVDLIKAESSETASGTLSGFFSVNKISLAAALKFGVPEETYLFKVQFDQVWLEASTAWTGNKDNRHQVVSLQLGGVTLGDMLEYLVNLAAPTLGFRLDSPWDALKQIDLSRFVLTIDPQENSVEFVFTASVNLVVMKIDTVGIRYTQVNGTSAVNLILTGDFLGKNYGSDKPLSWDVINDPPPAVPGAGISLVNLRYLGLGQRVTFSTARIPDTVAESILLLRKSMQPVTSASANPLDGQGVVYNSNSQWLIGLDIQLMETVDLGFIFNDPVLYGLSIALSGEKAGTLAGLRFELLYKKITNDIGMFRVELRVPDAFRTFQLGAASFTLGIIVVEVYTNGNFMVDLGFPYNRNFDRSFSMSAGIFIGRGGFYFGVLDGNTSTRVPAITNGNFSPVLELGIGIAAGVGKEISAGILSGGIYVELEVIFQGVLGWFNPNSSGMASAEFFSCQGMVAIHGKLYGSVDFKVVKVSITLEAYIQVSVIYECYKKTVFALAVMVRASAKVKILFIKISFSFKVNLDVSFTIGSDKQTPWILVGSSQGGTPGLTANTAMASTGRSSLRTNPRLRTALLRKEHQGKLRAMRLKDGALGVAADTATGYSLNWQPENTVFPDSPRTAQLTMIPLFTVGDVPVSWSDTVPANDAPNYRAAFVLCADTGMPADAETVAQEALRSSALSAMTATDDDTSLLAADILVQGLLMYALYAVPREASEGGAITSGQLALLAEELLLPETYDIGFSLANLSLFFETNILLQVSGDPVIEPDTKTAMVFPMPPFISWTSPQNGEVDFMTTNMIGALYESRVSQALGSYSPVNSESAEAEDDPSAYESFAGFMFRDFCLMIVKSAVEEAQKKMDDTSVTIQSDADGNVWSLADAANSLPQAGVTYTVCSGNTMDSVAAALGATVEELEFLNPSLAADLNEAVGTLLPVKLGIAPEVLATDNADVAFVEGQWNLGTIYHQTASGDTLSAIAELFNLGTDGVTNLLGFNNGMRVNLSADPNLLLVRSTFDLPQRSFDGAPADYSRTRTAAAFFTRYASPDLRTDSTGPDMAVWYAQAIATINAVILNDLFPDQHILADVELKPGQQLMVPNSYNCAYNEAGYTNLYTTITGDTLLRIGTALGLQQDFPTTSPVPASSWQDFTTTSAVPALSWQDFLAEFIAANPSGSAPWIIPAWTGIIVAHGETVESLSRRLICDVAFIGAAGSSWIWDYAWADIAEWIGPALILAPVAVVPVPDATTAKGVFSFNDLTKIYGISITDAAAQLKEIKGLFELATVLAVKHLPAQEISVLVDSVVQGESFAAIVNQSSRMLMSGLQLPALTQIDGHTVPDPGKSLPLYDLTGQQFTVAVDTAQPDAVALSLSVSSSVDWITLMDSTTAVQGTTLAQIETLEIQYPDIRSHNPGIGSFSYPLGSSIVLLTQPVSMTTGTLDYSYTNQQVLDNSPQTGLSVRPADALSPNPQAMPLSGVSPRPYGFDQRIDLQTPVVLPIPAASPETNLSGLPSLWPFPESFLVQAEAGTVSPYEILAALDSGEAGRHANVLTDTTFGMVVPFRIAKFEAGTLHFNLLGVDTDQRHLLLSLREQLLAYPDTESATAAYLLLSPAPNASNATGITVLTPADQGTFLIKSNLSTDSVPQPTLMLATAAAAESPVYFATLSSLADFLLLLWEGSVVGGTGYYFGVSQDLPGSAFDSDGNASLQLLVIAGSQQDTAPTGRTLLTFNNCLLVGPGLANTTVSLFAESYDDSDMIINALVPPGNVGFRIATDKPVDVSDPALEKEVQLRNLYSLLSFQIEAVEGSPFYAPPSGMPAPPLPWDGDGQTLAQREKSLRKMRPVNADLTDTEEDSEPYWLYEQVLPLYNFLLPDTEQATPYVAGLPLPANDPYAGLGTRSSLPEVRFLFGFGDLLGNRTAPPGAGEGILDLTSGYTDNMIGVGEWPSIAYSYEVFPASGDIDVMLSAFVTSRPSALLPNPSQPGDISIDPAILQAERYRQVYYQLVQSNIDGYLLTTLHQDQDGTGLKLQDITPLIHFAAGAYAHANTVASLLPAAVGETTIDGMIASFGVRYAEIAQANADFLVEQLFGASVELTVPAYFPFVEHDSVTTLCELPPAGWPTPSATELLLFPENATFPLKTGTALTIPATKLSTGTVAPTATLTQLAATLNTTVPLLAGDNVTDPVLADRFVFTVDIGNDQTASVTVNTASGPSSFKQVVEQFADIGVNLSVPDLAVLYADSDGVFATGQDLVSTFYVVKLDDTLTVNSSGVSLEDLVAANLETLDLFDPGALIYFGDFTGISYDQQPPLREFADRYACTMELLISANSAIALPADTAFRVPGVLAWPADTTVLRIPYTMQVDDTLSAIAERFSSPGGSGGGEDYLIALANEYMPGTICSGIAIKLVVDGNTVTVVTEPNASFGSVLAQIQEQAPTATLADLVASISATEGVLQGSGLLVCAPAQLPSNCAPAGIFSLYNIDGGTFALANAATPGLIVGGIELISPDGSVAITTQDGDTFNSLIARFASEGVQVDAKGIVDAQDNAAKVFLKGGALALLAPAPIQLSVEIGAEGPYPGPIFPLDVSLRLTRPAGLISKDFADDGPVQRVDSNIPAPATDDKTDPASGLTFNNFVSMMNSALPNLRLATGKVDGVGSNLWCVDFSESATGISSVALSGGTSLVLNDVAQPRFLGLTPLYDHLVTRNGISIQPLKDDGTLGTAVSANFQGIDVELWAERFLSDFDRLLSGAYASAIYVNTDTQASLTSLLAGKQALVPAIAAGLDTVLDIADDDKASGLLSAMDSLEQQLGVSLSRAFDISVVIQYNGEVSSPWLQDPALLPANLYGDGRIDGTAATLTMVAAKTNLDVANSFVNFLMTVKDPSHNRDISGSFCYDISYAEFDISGADTPAPYVASDWLSFVPLLAGTEKPAALAKTDPGYVDAPIALRVFPNIPIIKGQTADSDAADGNLASQSLWTYGLTYSHEHAEQDYVVITAEFNLGLQESLLALETDKDLFTELAQYMAVADELWNDLNGLVDSGLGVPEATIENAVETAADLIGRVAESWSLPRIGQAAGSALTDDNYTVGSSYSFNARVDYKEQTYTLIPLQQTFGPAGHWPSVTYIAQDGSQVLLNYPDHEIDGRLIYTVPAGSSIETASWPIFTLSWEALNVSATQNARARLSVERNQNLIDGVPTNPLFLFKTSEVMTSGLATPLLISAERLEITGDNPGAALDGALAALFPAQDRLANLALTYGLFYAYELISDPADPSKSLTSRIPVALYPDQILTSSTGTDINNALSSWQSQYKPSTEKGEWIFSIILYSAMDSVKRPLLSLDQVFYRIIDEAAD
ncbi:MAG: hypothetical protein ACXWT0_01430 [Methylobacter sp.]